MGSLITSVADDPEKVAQYISDCKRIGIKIMPPDINRSGYGFTIEEDGLRFGLGGIKGVGANVVEVINANKPFVSLEDLVIRVPKRTLNKKVLNALVFSGALDSLDLYADVFGKPTNRMELLQHVYKLREDKEEVDIESFDEKAKLTKELELLGLFVSGHPLEKYADPTDWDGLYPGMSVDVMGLVTAIRKVTTKKGDPMAFVTINTLEGDRSLTVFPRVYATCAEELCEGKIVKTKIAKDRGPGESLIANEIKIPKRLKAKAM